MSPLPVPSPFARLRRGPRLGPALGCALLLAGGALHGDEARGNDTPMGIGFNVDLIPTPDDAEDPDIGYTPQFWVGFGRSRLRFIGEPLEMPEAFTKAVHFFSPPATDAFETMSDDPVVAAPLPVQSIRLGGKYRLMKSLTLRCRVLGLGPAR